MIFEDSDAFSRFSLPAWMPSHESTQFWPSPASYSSVTSPVPVIGMTVVLGRGLLDPEPKQLHRPMLLFSVVRVITTA